MSVCIKEGWMPCLLRRGVMRSEVCVIVGSARRDHVGGVDEGGRDR